MENFSPDTGILPSEVIEDCIEDMFHLVIDTANKYHVETDRAIELIDLTIKLLSADHKVRALGDIERSIDRVADECDIISRVVG